MSQRKREWIKQLVADEGITDTRIVSSENVDMWVKEYNDIFGGSCSAESFKRQLRAARFSKETHDVSDVIKLVVPVVRVTGNVLIIGDLHEPFTVKGYLEFCKAMFIKHDCKTVVFIGDIVDNHYSSFHDADPDADYSAGQELKETKRKIAEWHEAFPNAYVCLGNHDNIPQRKMFNAGLSNQWMKPIEDVLDTPTWTYAHSFTFDDITYTHGTGRIARARMKGDLKSVVQGHYHSQSYIEYAVGPFMRLFAMQIGAGMDRESYAAAYGREFNMPHINVGVIKDQGKLPMIEYM